MVLRCFAAFHFAYACPLCLCVCVCMCVLKAKRKWRGRGRLLLILPSTSLQGLASFAIFYYNSFISLSCCHCALGNIKSTRAFGVIMEQIQRYLYMIMAFRLPFFCNMCRYNGYTERWYWLAAYDYWEHTHIYNNLHNSLNYQVMVGNTFSRFVSSFVFICQMPQNRIKTGLSLLFMTAAWGRRKRKWFWCGVHSVSTDIVFGSSSPLRTLFNSTKAKPFFKHHHNCSTTIWCWCLYASSSCIRHHALLLLLMHNTRWWYEASVCACKRHIQPLRKASTNFIYCNCK